MSEKIKPFRLRAMRFKGGKPVLRYIVESIKEVPNPRTARVQFYDDRTANIVLFHTTDFSSDEIERICWASGTLPVEKIMLLLEEIQADNGKMVPNETGCWSD